MTAIGFVLFIIGMSAMTFMDMVDMKFDDAPKTAMTSIGMALLGFMLLLSGIASWLWKVMP